ncbi:hypothetical protein Trydic_g3416 [Trypoxylus dichotomus]
MSWTNKGNSGETRYEPYGTFDVITLCIISIKISMESPVISVLILTSLISSTSQDCYDVLHTDQSNCFRSNGRTFYTHYSRPCNDYHVTQCSAIIHRIQSRIKNLVHKIIVNSGDIETLNRTLLCGFCKLESITITGSNISNIQLYSFSNLLALQSVHLTNNVVGVLSQGQLNSNSLEILDLSNNSIRSFENISLNLDILSSLNLSNNPLFYVKDPSIDLFQNTLKLQSLNLSLTGIKQIHIGTFSKLANLRILDLSQNNLTALPKGIFHDLKNLMQLYLNHNRLKYFQYEGLTNLAKIDLNANLFTCDTLVDIISISIRIGVHIINGNTRNTKNTFGIDCMDSDPAKSQDIEFFIKVEQIIQELLLQQANTSIFLATNQQNRSDAYWRNLTQDFKGYLGTMQQTTKDTIYKLTTIFTSSMNTSTVKIDELGGTLKTELSNFFSTNLRFATTILIVGSHETSCNSYNHVCAVSTVYVAEMSQRAL